MRGVASPVSRGVLKSYGPLGGTAVAFLLLAALVQPLPREKQTVTSGGRGSTAIGVSGAQTGGTQAGVGAIQDSGGAVAGNAATPDSRTSPI